MLGLNTHGRIIVEYAIPFQAAERKFAEVTPNWRRELKVTEILPKIIHLEKLGYFHSHPMFGKSRGLPQLSEKDKDYMQFGEIELVVAINDSKKSLPWKETKKGLRGTLGNYHIIIAGFRKTEENKQIMNCRIICPYATGFDLALGNR